MCIAPRFVRSFLALALLLGVGSATALADPHGPKGVTLTSPQDGDVYHVGDEFVIEGKSRGNHSYAQVHCFLTVVGAQLGGGGSTTRNKWSFLISGALPIASDPAYVFVIYYDEEEGI